MECIEQTHAQRYSLYCGDCCEITSEIEDYSIDFSIYSPPFVGLYIYSDSERDLGNCAGWPEFFQHYTFLLKELYRATVSGRLTVVHCKDLPAYHHRDGYAGLQDFPGQIVKAHEDCGWSYHSRVTIWKCPVVERERTNNNGLLHKTLLRDRSQLRQGMADYLLVFRKTPDVGLESSKPVKNGPGLQDYVGLPECDPRVGGSFHPSPYARKSTNSVESINIWRRYAEPVWWDINQQDVLNVKEAREDKDEKHICPLQLDVIRRSIQLWTNHGEIVFSPFMGIGSEGYVAMELGRKFIGIELKESYYDQAVANIQAAAGIAQSDLFSLKAGE